MIGSITTEKSQGPIICPAVDDVLKLILRNRKKVNVAIIPVSITFEVQPKMRLSEFLLQTLRNPDFGSIAIQFGEIKLTSCLKRSSRDVAENLIHDLTKNYALLPSHYVATAIHFICALENPDMIKLEDVKSTVDSILGYVREKKLSTLSCTVPMEELIWHGLKMLESQDFITVYAMLIYHNLKNILVFVMFCCNKQAWLRLHLKVFSSSRNNFVVWNLFLDEFSQNLVLKA